MGLSPADGIVDDFEHVALPELAERPRYVRGPRVGRLALGQPTAGERLQVVQHDVALWRAGLRSAKGLGKGLADLAAVRIALRLREQVVSFNGAVLVSHRPQRLCLDPRGCKGHAVRAQFLDECEQGLGDGAVRLDVGRLVGQHLLELTLHGSVQGMHGTGDEA